MATLFSDMDRSTSYSGNVGNSQESNSNSAVIVQHQQQQQQQLQQQQSTQSSINNLSNNLNINNVSSSLTTPSSQSLTGSPSSSPLSGLSSSPTSSNNLLINGIGNGCSSTNSITSSITTSNGNSNGSTNLVEDSRALQLALELSMVGLSDPVSAAVVAASAVHHQQQQQQQQQLHQQHQHHTNNHQQYVEMTNSLNNQQNGLLPGTTLNQFAASILPSIDDRSKKSQNMTECVPVPSSEHVAEIVGRQGCKIKALRAKTNTYIKTPVRGEEPVFVVTGRKEDVSKAKREILSAAEHFSLIRASRKPVISGNGGLGKAPPGPPSIPGQVTIQVRVPYRVVGLVVGPKGATIKHIQQETNTYIVTPSRDKEPIFEVTGLPDNVQASRKQIEAHIALRTGNTSPSVHTINSLSQMLSDDISPEFLASLYKNGICAGFDYGNDQQQQQQQNQQLHQQQQQQQQPQISNNQNGGINGILGQTMIGSGVVGNGVVNGINTNNNAFQSNVHQSVGVNLNSGNVGANNSSVGGGSTGSRSCSSSSSSTSSKSASNSRPELMNIWKSLGDSIDVDEGLGDSPNIWTLPPVSSQLNSRCSPSASISPIDSLLSVSDIANHIYNATFNNPSGSVNTAVTGNYPRRDCLVCGEKEVNAALLPCGHNMFCIDCATRVRASDGPCPVCSQSVAQAIHIKIF